MIKIHFFKYLRIASLLMIANTACIHQRRSEGDVMTEPQSPESKGAQGENTELAPCKRETNCVCSCSAKSNPAPYTQPV